MHAGIGKSQCAVNKVRPDCFWVHAGIGKSHLAALVVGQSLVRGKAVLLEQVPFSKHRARSLHRLRYKEGEALLGMSLPAALLIDRS